MTRQRKSPRQIAEERLGVAQRKAAKLDKAIEKAEGELATLRIERAEAVRRREYAERDPALSDETLDEGATDEEDGTDG